MGCPFDTSDVAKRNRSRRMDLNAFINQKKKTGVEKTRQHSL
jgi:hypothetical protein